MTSTGTDIGTRGTALVTGASSGIGAEFARALAAEGYDLVLVARRRERLEVLAAELKAAHGIDAEVLVADLADDADIARVEQRVAALDRLDLLVNNAGFGTEGRFAEIDLDRQLDMITVHVVATVRLVHAALPGMIARNRGGIVNVASLLGFLATPGSVTYCATKACLITFSQALAAELTDTDVRVQVLCPGYIVTGFHDTDEFRDFDRRQVRSWLWMTPQQVVARALADLRRGRVVCVPGFRYRILLRLLRSRIGNWLVRTFGRNPDSKSTR